MKRYNNSISTALQAIFPEHAWESQKFAKKPNGFLRNQANQRHFLQSAATTLGYKSLHDWYSTTPAQIKSSGLTSFLANVYTGSLSAALSANFPEHDWIEWKFRFVSRGFWKDRLNRRRFFDWAGEQLGIDSKITVSKRNMSKWYSVNRQALCALGAASLLVSYYKDSVSNALLELYPEFNWDMSQFRRIGASFADADESSVSQSARARGLAESLAVALKVSDLEDWYRVSVTQRQQMRKGLRMKISTPSLAALLTKAYPEHSWDLSKLSKKNKRAEQRALLTTVRKMFASEEIVEEYSHAELVFPKTNSRISIDIYLPNLKIGFEYQGKQHRRDINVPGAAASQLERDIDKLAICSAAGIKIIMVPDSWDGTEASLRDLLS